jgi:hypothetical protein
LQLRVALREYDNGVCQATVEEHADRVCVRAVVCMQDDEETDWRAIPVRHETDCGARIWLDMPLGTRVVIDLDTGLELPLYIPRWGTGEPSYYVPRPPGDLWPPDDAPRENTT